MRLVETVVAVNEARKKAMAERVIAACGGSVAGKTIAVLGVTFKPNTDDMRDAPSLVIVPALQAAGATLRGYDPAGMTEAGRLLSDVALVRGRLFGHSGRRRPGHHDRVERVSGARSRARA